MDEPIPEVTAQILLPEEVLLRPPRTTLGKAVDQTVETVSGWMDWLKEKGENVISKAWPKLQELKKIIESLWKKQEFEVKKKVDQL